jgi:hypothetical protein
MRGKALIMDEIGDLLVGKWNEAAYCFYVGSNSAMLDILSRERKEKKAVRGEETGL